MQINISFLIILIPEILSYLSNGNTWVSNNYMCFTIQYVTSIQTNFMIPEKTSLTYCSALVSLETNYTGFCYIQKNSSCFILPEGNISTLFRKALLNSVLNQTDDRCCVYTAAKECSPPFKIIPDVGCIYVTKFNAPWQEARQFCQGFGADLWSDPDNVENMSALLNEDPTVGLNFWIALKKLTYTTGFFWPDGSQAFTSGANKWSGWNERYLQVNYEFPKCGAMRSSDNYSVASIGCLGLQFALCEKKIYV